MNRVLYWLWDKTTTWAVPEPRVPREDSTVPLTNATKDETVFEDRGLLRKINCLQQLSGNARFGVLDYPRGFIKVIMMLWGRRLFIHTC